MVPVLVAYQARLVEVAGFFGGGFVVGGADPVRRNVTSGLIASLAGGADLARLDVGRLRSTWLARVAQAIGLPAFMAAAGIRCTQRLGDIVAGLRVADEAAAVALWGSTLSGRELLAVTPEAIVDASGWRLASRYSWPSERARDSYRCEP